MTFYAIHKETGIEVVAAELYSIDEKIFVSTAHNCGLRIEDSQLAPDWFKSHKFILPKEILVNPQNYPDDIEVLPRKGCLKDYRKQAGRFNVQSHFYIPNKENLGIETCGESMEHKNAIISVYSSLVPQGLEKSDLKIRLTDGVIFSISDFGKKDIDWNQRKTLYSLNPKCNISDILLTFEKYNEHLGAGICFEIQTSKKSDSERLQRTESWANMEFSICWIEKEDFEWDDKLHPTLKSNILDVTPCFHTLNKLSKKNNELSKYLIEKCEEKYQDLKKLEEHIKAEYSQKMFQLDCKAKELDSNQKGLITKINTQYYQTAQPAIDDFKEKINLLMLEKSDNFLEFETQALKDGHAALAEKVYDEVVMQKYAERYNTLYTQKYRCLSCAYCDFVKAPTLGRTWKYIDPFEKQEYRYIRSCWKHGAPPEKINVSDDSSLTCDYYSKRRDR